MRRQAIQTIATQIAVLLLGFVSTLITARSLGADGRGAYFLAVTFAGIVMQFANLGLQSGNVYYVSQDESLLPSLVGNSIWVSLAATCAMVLIGFAIISSTGFVHASQVPYLWIAASYAPAATFCLVCATLFTGIHRVDLYNAFMGFMAVLSLAANVAAALYWPTVTGFLVASVASYWIPATLLLIALRIHWKARFSLDPALLKHCARYACKAYSCSVLAFLILRCNVFILNRFATQAEIGRFSIAAQIGDGLMVFPSAVALVLFPRLVRADDPWTLFSGTLRKMTALAALACAVAATLAGPFVRLAFGIQFAEASSLLMWMLPGVFFFSILTIVSQYLSAHGFLPMQVASWAIVLAVLLAAALTLIPRYLATGASLSLSIAYTVLFVLLLGVAQRHHRGEGRSTNGKEPASHG